METESSKINSQSNQSTKDIDLFFANGLYNSCEATDALIKSIEDSQNEALANKTLALYQRHYSTLERPWDHVTFMYGLGLIYMHFNAYNWAVKAFREAIYVQPNFARSRDVHTRLGLIFKATGRFKLSEKHFKLAINDKRFRSGTSSDLELRFHLAHLLEVQGKMNQAREAYEKLLQENDLPYQLSANINRQLGWMFFYADTDSSSKSNNHDKQSMFNNSYPPSNSRIEAALNHLNISYKASSEAKTSYFLGRCFTNIGRFQDAFAAYRSVIDRDESTADTWCSIGVLYHRQNQPTDALQAYIRSVQFNKRHKIAWINLGILYENHNQFHDALKCYQHALRSTPNEIDNSLQSRVDYIQKQVAEVESFFCNGSKQKLSSDKLLSLEELWNLESKISSGNSVTNPSKNSKVANHSVKTTSTNHTSSILLQPSPKQSEDRSYACQMRNGSDHIFEVKHTNSKPNENSANNNVILLRDSSDTLQIEANQNCLSSNSHHQGITNGVLNSLSTDVSNDNNHYQRSSQQDSKDFCLSQALTNGASKDSGISSNSSTSADCTSIPSHANLNAKSHMCAEQVIEAHRNSPRPKKVDINLLHDDSRPPCKFPQCPPYPPLPNDKLLPSPPSIFLETKKDLTTKKLQEYCQSNPISIVRNIASVLKLDLGLFSTKTLVESNPDHQVEVSSHIYRTTGDISDDCDRNLWICERHCSSSTISNYASYQVSTFRDSIQEERETKMFGNKSSLMKEPETDSNESISTHAKRLNLNIQSTSQINNDSRSSNNQYCRGSTSKKIKREQPKVKFVKSADDIDLSDDKKWRSQLNELNKLPHFIKCVSASNMLTHVGSAIPKINTILMSMHVPGCRILGNRTPNHFCPVNINIGPGDYEWCAISGEYCNILTRLCNKNGFEIESPDWWPKMSDLQKHNIPIYRFSQRPGDLVWVNSGTFYWVQANGWCNNIHWNVGPLCAKQYRYSSESFELNKLIYRKSDVPMVQLTWNIVININLIVDDELFLAITDVLRKSLRYCLLVQDLVDELGQSVHQLEGNPGPRTARFCSLCEVEVFNFHFIKRSDGCQHCIECARKSNTTLAEFDIRQEYNLNYLMKLHDDFIETKKKFKARQQNHTKSGS